MKMYSKSFTAHQIYVALVFILGLHLGCEDNISGIIDNSFPKWQGQVVSELVNAILKPDGTVWAWGLNYCGTLGNGTTDDSEYPVKVLNLSGIVSIDLFHGAAFAADREGNIWYWGNYIIWGGNPFIDTNVTAPIKIANVKDVTSISVWGVTINCLTKDGSVWKIYMNTVAPEVYQGPTKYPELNNIISIHKFYALSSDGRIFKLGSGECFASIPEGIKMIQSTQGRIVVLKSDGTVWAWGKNEQGELGNGTFEDSDVPVKVNDLDNVISISSNYGFNLALKKDGTVWFWGFAGKEGETLIGQNTPVKIEGLEDIVLIYANRKNLVKRKDGTYWIFNFDNRIPQQVQFN